MKLNLSFIKNESIIKFEKAIKKSKCKFEDMISIALDVAMHEVDEEKRGKVSIMIGDLFNYELSKILISYTKCLNIASEIIENELGS